MTPYQKRMRNAIWVSSAYGLAGLVALGHYNAPFLGWFIYASVIVLIAVILIASDAIFDSLREMLNESNDGY